MDYKKILEGVVDIINTTEKSDIGFANICTYIGENCPELKESEDERIRKALIRFHKSSIDIDGIKGDDILAWLEKQGEQKETLCDKCKKAQPSHSCQDITALGRCYIENINTSTNKVEPKSQRMVSAEAKEAMYGKPANEEMIETLRTEYEKGRADAIAEMQKDWSKEDEERIKNIISVLDWDGATGKKENPYQEEIDWLYSLKNRVQPKQEWSEENEMMLDEIIDFFENGTVRLQHDLSLYAFWLKSLKDRCTWKPSDEQLEVLLGEANAWTKGCPKQKILESLYNDLNKLKA